MTLIVGAIFPWRELINWPDWPMFKGLTQVIHERGVILCTDSRWTYPDGRTEDGAVKLFGVSDNAIAAYAGSAVAGEDAIIRLATEPAAISTLQDWREWTQTAIATVWAQHQPNDDALEILYGVSFESGNVQLWHFSSRDRFRAREVDDMIAIGPEKARTHFRQVLRDVIRQNVDLAKARGISMSIETWSSILAIAVNDAAELGIYQGVGGPIICGYSMSGRSEGVGVVREGPGPNGVQTKALGLAPGAGKKIRKAFKWTPPSLQR